MRHRRLLRVGGLVLLGVVVTLAGCGSFGIGPSLDDLSRTRHTTTEPPAGSATAPPTGDARIPYTAVSVEFAGSNRFGLFRATAVDGPITRAGHVAVLVHARARSRIAFERLAEATTERNVSRFVNRTTFAQEALVVFSQRFGSRGGEYEIAAFRKQNRTTWRVRTVREAGPLNAESTGVIVLRINRTATPLPEQLRIVHRRADGTFENRTVSLG